MSPSGPQHSEQPLPRDREPGQQVPETKYAQPGLRRNTALWFGVLAPPLAWALLLELNYALVSIACDGVSRALLLGTCLATLLLSVAGGFVAWSMYVGLRAAPDEREAPVAGRERFMALGGLLSSLTFSLVIVATAVPVFFLRTCD
jgi:hypothetical protein